MAEEQVINTAIEFLDKIRNSEEAKVKFQKKDGSTRIMKCTLDFNKVPVAQRPKDVNLSKILNLIQKSNIIHVYDLEKKDWRSIPFDKAEWVDIPGQARYSIKR
jgi:hypothetical protein